MREPPLTTGSCGTGEFLLCHDHQVNCPPGGQLFLEMKLGRLFDVRKELVEVFSLSMDPVIHSRGAPNTILITEDSDLYQHEGIPLPKSPATPNHRDPQDPQIPFSTTNPLISTGRKRAERSTAYGRRRSPLRRPPAGAVEDAHHVSDVLLIAQALAGLGGEL